jgi:2-polyprenyl-3-methyl-5-hydroxy-6-metoxy-1,4-benzoquinol methylase
MVANQKVAVANPAKQETRSDYEPELYDAIAPGYYDHVFERGRGVQWFWHYYRYAAVVANLPKTGNSILDLGCGPGTFLGNYAGGYRRALGVDLARAQIEYAIRKYANDRVQFNATDAIGFTGKEKFDVVVSIEVIEHLPLAETHSFLRIVFELLSPGGMLVLATPNYSSLWPFIERYVSKIGPVDYVRQHINRFTLPRLERELTNAGFVVENKRTIFIASPFLAFVSSRLAKMVYRLEQRFLPWHGSEIVISARRPLD